MERKTATIGDKITELRTKKGLLQERLGNLLGVSRQTVMRWEGGTSHPNMSDIEHMCALFNVPINYFSTAAEVAATNSDARPDTKITVESNCEPQVSEPIFRENGYRNQTETLETSRRFHRVYRFDFDSVIL